MKNSVHIRVETKTIDLFRFMLFHAYMSISGIITVIFGVGSLIMLPVTYFVWKDTFVSLVLLMLVVVYVIITPLNMLSQSKRQVMSNPVFKNPIEYQISQEGIEVQQYTGVVQLDWSQIYQIRKTPYDILIYVNEQQAFVLPKKIMSEEELGMLQNIFESVEDKLPKQISFLERLGKKKTIKHVMTKTKSEKTIKVELADQEEEGKKDDNDTAQ